MSQDIETGVEASSPEAMVTVVEEAGGSKPWLDMSPDEKVESLVAAHPVMVFAKSHCPFCRDVVEFLSGQMGVHVSVLNINEHPDGAVIHKAVKDQTGHSTVPAVFIKGEFIGGCDTVKALHAKNQLEPNLSGLVLAEQTLDTSKLETAKLVPVYKGEARHPLFWFPNVVNNYVVRLTGLQVFILAVISAVFHQDLWGRYLAVGLLIDFVLRMVAGSSVSPLGMIATVIVSPFRPQFRPGPPKQFASFCGVTFSLLSTIFYFGPTFEGHDIVGAVVVAMLAGAAGLEAFFDFCLGCLFFSYGIKFGIFPDSVYRIYTSSRQEVEDTWDYANSKSDEPKPELIDTDPTSKISLKYKPKSDEWTKDDFHLIRNMQVTYFGMPLAISGLAVAFKIASDWGDQLGSPRDIVRSDIVPQAWYHLFALIGGVVFVIMLVLYALRFVLYPRKCKHEWDCPLRSPAFGTIAITFMLFAFVLYDEIADNTEDSGAQWVARIIFWIGAVAQSLLTVAKMGEWIGKRLELEHVHAQWLILPVGLSVAALVAPQIPMFETEDQRETKFVSVFFFSFAFLMWVTLFVMTFFKTVTTHNSDNRVRHGAFIWLAAPCVIGLARLSICAQETFSSIDECEAEFSQYYFIGMFIFLALLWATLPYIAFFGRDKFEMAYWTECFALDTLAACGAAFYALNNYNASRTLMYIGLVIASIANMCTFLHTIAALIRRRGIFTPEVKWGPLSFMKLTHEAFRGNMEKLRRCLEDLDLSDKSEEGSRKLGMFAAHFRRFQVVHEEHAKHEDEVIFKTFNDYFPAHAKKWNDDHKEDHIKMEGWCGAADLLLDKTLDDSDRQSGLETLKEELPPFFDHFLDHLKGEEDNLQCIPRKILPLELMKQISKECFRLTPADRLEIMIPFIINNLPRHEQRIRYLKVLTWSMPERAQQIGAIVYRNVDAVMWERLRVEVPEVIPRGLPNWRRYY